MGAAVRQFILEFKGRHFVEPCHSLNVISINWANTRKAADLGLKVFESMRGSLCFQSSGAFALLIISP